jgi:hypothetical protein
MSWLRRPQQHRSLRAGCSVCGVNRYYWGRAGVDGLIVPHDGYLTAKPQTLRTGIDAERRRSGTGESDDIALYAAVYARHEAHSRASLQLHTPR